MTKCKKCNGCGRVGYSKGILLSTSAMFNFHRGLLKPFICPTCDGSGKLKEKA